jgi:hypothetical protein
LAGGFAVLYSSTPHEPSGEGDGQDAQGCFGPALPPAAGGAAQTPGPLLMLGRHLRVVQSGFGSVDDWRKSLELFACRVFGLHPVPRRPAFEPQLDRLTLIRNVAHQPFADGLTPRQRFALRGDSGVPPLASPPLSAPPSPRFVQA